MKNASALPGTTSLSAKEELKKVRKEKEALQERFNDLERDWHKQRYNLDWYYRKSSKLKEEKKTKQVELERKEAEIAELKFSVEKKTEESNRDRKNYMNLCLLHEKEKAEKKELSKKAREKHERVESFKRKLNRKQDEIRQLKEEAKLWQDEKIQILDELAQKKGHIKRQNQLILEVGGQLLERDITITELTESVVNLEQDKIQMEEKLKCASEEKQTLEGIVKRLGRHCGRVNVPLGAGNLEALALYVEYVIGQIGVFDDCYQILNDLGLGKKPESQSNTRQPLSTPPPPPSNVRQPPRTSSFTQYPSSPTETIIIPKTENPIRPRNAEKGVYNPKGKNKLRVSQNDDHVPHKHSKYEHHSPLHQNESTISNMIKIENK